MTQVLTVTCNHCGNELDEHDTRGRSHKKDDPDYCHTCLMEKDGIEGCGNQLSELMLARWEKGGLDLTREGVVDIVHTSHEYEPGDRKEFAAVTVRLTPIDDYLHSDLSITPYVLKSLYGKKDKYGENGFDVYRSSVLVGRIRWVKLPDKKTEGPSWEHSFAWSNNEPGVLKWNHSQAGFVESLG